MGSNPRGGTDNNGAANLRAEASQGFPGLNLLRSVILSPFVGEEDSFDGMKCASWKHLSFRDELRLQDEVIKRRSFISSRLAGDLC